MTSIDYGVIALYFAGLMAVSAIVSRRIRNSEDMFIAGRNSSWWLSGMSTYMTLFSASTFVIWGGVAYRSGLVAVLIANLVGVACFLAGRAVAGRWRSLRIKSPGEFLTVRFGKSTLDFYTIVGLVGRGVHTAVALYAIAVVMSTLMPLAPDNPFADPATGRLAISWAVLLLGAVTLLYTMAGGFLAVLMTDVIQFGVLITVVLFMIPLSLHEIGGLESFIAAAPEGFFVPASASIRGAGWCCGSSSTPSWWAATGLSCSAISACPRPGTPCGAIIWWACSTSSRRSSGTFRRWPTASSTLRPIPSRPIS